MSVRHQIAFTAPETWQQTAVDARRSGGKHEHLLCLDSAHPDPVQPPHVVVIDRVFVQNHNPGDTSSPQCWRRLNMAASIVLVDKHVVMAGSSSLLLRKSVDGFCNGGSIADQVGHQSHSPQDGCQPKRSSPYSPPMACDMTLCR